MCEIRDKDGLTEAEFLAGYNSDAYPKPALTADICVIAKDGDSQEILLIKRGNHPFLGHWALPGGFANRNEPAEETAARELSEETGIEGIPLKLTGFYSAPGRDPRGWTVSAAYTAVIDKYSVNVQAGDDAAEAKWFKIQCADGEISLINGEIILPVTEGVYGTGKLAFDHTHIISDALESI